MSNSSSVGCVFLVAGSCLPNRCLAMAVSSGFTVPAFRRQGETQTQQNNLISLFFFQNKASRLIKGCLAVKFDCDCRVRERNYLFWRWKCEDSSKQES
jgi:hypothetical protein